MDFPLKIAVCEDLQEDRALLLSIIKASSPDSEIFVFENGEAFLETYKKGLFHLIILDIYMTGMTGLQVASAIRNLNDNTPIAFTTTSRDHALEANHYHAILYMEKPVTLRDVSHVLKLASAVSKQQMQETLVIKDNERCNVTLPFNDIVCVFVENHRCTIQLYNGEKIYARTSTTLDELEESLPKPQFYRSHRSFIVNFDFVSGTDENYNFILPNGQKAYVRVKDFQKAKKAFEDYIFDNLRK